MRISTKDWVNFREKLSKLNREAAEKMTEFVQKRGFGDPDLIEYAYGLVTKYGEGSAALSALMYDAVAEMEGKTLPAAVPAPTPDKNEVAKMVNGVKKWSKKPESIGNAVGRMVKRTGADTTLQNAQRDGAEFAWVPHGDTCAFCIALASRGWQHISKNALKNGHAEHIHANCDCTYAIRFNPKTSIAGYNPDKYKEMYDNAEGNTPEEKIRYMRRERDAEKKIIASISDTSLLDEIIPKSVGAKFRNYDIMDLQTGEIYHLAEGTKLQNKEVFAGKGKKEKYRIAYKYAEKYGGKAEDWQHVKGIGVLSTPDGDRKAEIHWSQCEGIGKKDMNIKKWLE